MLFRVVAHTAGRCTNAGFLSLAALNGAIPAAQKDSLATRPFKVQAELLFGSLHTADMFSHRRSRHCLPNDVHPCATRRSMYGACQFF